MSVARVSSLRILFVEDHPDVRESLAEVLRDMGYAVTTAGTAEDGLNLLESQTFDVVLSDYDLPGRDGGWMIERAIGAQRIAASHAMLVTAHPRPRAIPGVRILHKPVDLDEFTTLLRGISGEGDAARMRVRLTLYLGLPAPSSVRALAELRALLSEYAARQLELTVYDLNQSIPAIADEHRVLVTPTLVADWQGGRHFIVGDLRNVRPLRDLLEAAGVEPLLAAAGSRA